MTPTARSLAALRAEGYTAEVVEQIVRIPGARPRVFRRDLYGFGDILAFKPGAPPLIVQACITSDQADRLAKIAASATAARWLEAGYRIAVHGWAKRGPRGARKVWTLSETHVGRA